MELGCGGVCVNGVVRSGPRHNFRPPQVQRASCFERACGRPPFSCPAAVDAASDRPGIARQSQSAPSVTVLTAPAYVLNRTEPTGIRPQDRNFSYDACTAGGVNSNADTSTCYEHRRRAGSASRRPPQGQPTRTRGAPDRTPETTSDQAIPSLTEAIAPKRHAGRSPKAVTCMFVERTTGFEPATSTLARHRQPSNPCEHVRSRPPRSASSVQWMGYGMGWRVRSRPDLTAVQSGPEPDEPHEDLSSWWRRAGSRRRARLRWRVACLRSSAARRAPLREQHRWSRRR